MELISFEAKDDDVMRFSSGYFVERRMDFQGAWVVGEAFVRNVYSFREF